MRARHTVGAVVVGIVAFVACALGQTRGAETNQGSGTAIDSAKREQKRAELDVAAARKRVSDASDYLLSARRQRAARESALHATTDAKAAVERMLVDATEAADRASKDETQSTTARDAAKQAVERLTKREVAQPAIPSEFEAYSLHQNGLFTLNFATGAWDVRLQPGFGASVSPSELEKMFGGSTPRSKVDMIDLAVDALGIKVTQHSNYEQVRDTILKQHSQQRVYVISERLLNWADPQRFGIDTGENELTGPGSISGEMRETAHLIQLEYEDVITWMKSQGDLDLSNGVRDALIELIKTGHSTKFGLSIQPVGFTVTKRYEPAGSSSIPLEVLRQVGLKRETSFRHGSFELDIPRTGFAIVRDKPLGTFSPTNAIERTSEKLVPPTFDLAGLGTDFTKGNGATLDAIAGAFRQGTAGPMDLAPKSRSLAAMAVALKKDELIRRASGDASVLNVMGTEPARQAAGCLRLLAQGNQGKATVNKAELDLQTQRLTIAFTLEHKHKIDSPKRAVAEIQATRKSTSLTVASFEESMKRVEAERITRSRENAIRTASDASSLAESAREKAQVARDRKATWQRELVAATNSATRATSELAEAKRVESLAQTEFDAAMKELTRSGAMFTQAGQAVDAATKAFADAVKAFFRQTNPSLKAMQAEARRVWR